MQKSRMQKSRAQNGRKSKNCVIFLSIFLLFFFLFLFTPGCRQGFRDEVKDINKTGLHAGNGDSDYDISNSVKGSNYPDSEAPQNGRPETKNIPPVAIIKIYQHCSSSRGDLFYAGSPVYFSARNSIDADGDPLSFRWYIDGAYKSTGDEISHIFDGPGNYVITLVASDGKDTVTVEREVYIAEAGSHFIVSKYHEATVGVKYIITNNGPVDIENIFCLIQVPQTYQPFQTIKNCNFSYNKTDEIYSDDYNLIAKFDLGSLSAGESKEAYFSCDALLSEYGYEKIEDEIYSYDPADADLFTYTKDEYYLNSNSRQIQSVVNTVIGEETIPVKMAEKLYNYVANRMDYDEERLGRGGTGSGYSYASEILQRGKGVCADYSILYTTLCRAAGIPAKFVQGIPVFSILTEGGGRLPYAHAWVEIKLPGYGWVPIEVTAENGFMDYNYYLNMETCKGSGVFYRSLSVENLECYPSGFYYSWKGNIEPDVTEEVIYTVSGLNPESLSVVSESEFLDNVGSILSEYNLSLNHINTIHSENWIYNDPAEISIEEALLSRLIELSGELEKISYPESYAADRDKLVEISKSVNLRKEAQIKCMKENNYDCTINESTLFISSLNELFEYYNDMVNRFNWKY